MPKKFRNDHNAVLDALVEQFQSERNRVSKSRPAQFGAEGFDRRKNNPSDKVGQMLKKMGIRQSVLRS